MTAFAPGLLDRLMGDAAQDGSAQLTFEQLKDSVARDLEALLNTRVAIPPQQFDGYPLARASVLNYGMADFAGMCLSSSDDRDAICVFLKAAIEIHEPRLTDVSATLEPEPGAVNRLTFVITARLVGGSSDDPVNFNAVLQPSSLRYAIAKSHRPRGRTEH
jgi:type VI secretion system protein ImpF